MQRARALQGVNHTSTPAAKPAVVRAAPPIKILYAAHCPVTSRQLLAISSSTQRPALAMRSCNPMASRAAALHRRAWVLSGLRLAIAHRLIPISLTHSTAH
jgi:hypothetical protein